MAQLGPPMRPRQSRIVLGLLAAAVSTVCAPGRRGDVVVDLGAGLPFADVRAEQSSILLGLPESRWHLGRGWESESWYQRRGRMVVVAGEPESTLEFRVAEPRGVTIRLLGRAFGDWAPGQGRFEVAVNGRSVGRAPVHSDFNWYEFAVGRDLVRAGANELAIRWPAIVGGGLPPSLGWMEMRVEPSDGGASGSGERAVVRYREDLRALLLPATQRLDYHLRLPEAGVLDIERVESASGRGGTLSIELAVDGEPSEVLARVEAPEAGVRVDLGAFAGRVVRLSLEAVAEPQGASFPGLEVGSPVIRSRAERPAERPAERAAARRGEGAAEGRLARRPNILIYAVDTLRRDHVGLYGYSRPVTPELDRFAATATVFEDAVAQSSWTRASMASVFTGLWPRSHATNGRKDVLAPEAVTLAELLRDQGYQTMAIVLNHNVFPVFGFEQGIDQFTKMTRGNSADATEAFLGWLDWRTDPAPFFAWIHPVDPHDPYVPRPELRERFDDLEGETIDLSRPPDRAEWSGWSAERRRRTVRHLVNLYDAEIAANDLSFGALLDGLEERDLLDETLIVFLSDHGEEFQEHGGWTHGHNLNVETLDVPLVIRFPDRGRGERVEALAQHIDVAPTVLDYLELPIPEIMEGRSLLGLLAGREASELPPAPAFSLVDLEGRPHLAVVEGDWKLIRRLEAPLGILTNLFHRRADPAETVNLAMEHPIRTRYLERLLDARTSAASLLTTSEAELDEETERALRALGYLQ
jgi:arylsulfatase A-like enzyme